MFDQGSAGSALAAGTVLVALIEVLIPKGVLDHADAAAVMRRASDALEPTRNIVSAQEALRIIGSLQRKFPK